MKSWKSGKDMKKFLDVGQYVGIQISKYLLILEKPRLITIEALISISNDRKNLLKTVRENFKSPGIQIVIVLVNIAGYQFMLSKVMRA